mgnify:CR=1 FL=1
MLAITLMKAISKAPPPSVVQRLTKYLAQVQTLCDQGVEWVSSMELAETLGLTSSTVRQDLSYLDFSGTSKRGYATAGLSQVLKGALGADIGWNMVVVGAGNLGRALALHEEFVRRGFNIVGIFDNDPKLVGRRIGRLTVQGMRDMPAVIGEKNVAIGVIAVPAPAAQNVSDILIASGIKGLLNLSLAHLIAPSRVAIIHSRMVASLMELTHAIVLGQRLTP